MALTITDEGNGTSTSSSATVVTGATIDASLGDWLAAIIAADNAGASGVSSISSVTDSAGNTWTQRAVINRTAGGVANDGTTLGIFTAAVSSALTGGTVTANFSPNTTSKAIQVYRIQPGVSESVQFVASDTTGSTGSALSHSAPTVSVTNGDTIFGCAALETSTAITGDSDTTNGNWSGVITRLANTGTNLTSTTCASQYKTVSATGNQDWACTTAGFEDSARSYLILRAVLSGILGTASITEADDTLTATSGLTIAGMLSATEANDTLSATAIGANRGQLNVTEDDDTLTSSFFPVLRVNQRGSGPWPDPGDYAAKRKREWEEELKRIIDRAFRIANGEIDPETLEPIPEPVPPDLSMVNDALASRALAADQAKIDAYIADEQRRQEDEAMAILLLAA